ncbi:MAG TPA: PQQ-binding-like beta-propeller repeat protein [Novosphingobium sp.]
MSSDSDSAFLIRPAALAIRVLIPALLALGAALLPPIHAAEINYAGRNPELEKSPGAQVYRENCAACHDAGVNRAPQRMMLQDLTPEAIRSALIDGAMRPQGSALSDDQKTAVAEYLSGRKLGASAVADAPNMCKGAAAKFDLGEPPAFTGWGLDPASTHSIPAAVSGLDKAGAGRLTLKWAFGFPNSSRARSHPIVAGGAILVGNHNGSVYALDRDTGCVRWAYAAQAEVRTGIVVSPWRAGDRAARPLAYFGDVRGNVYAVNLLDGTLAWKMRADAHPATVITGTPTLFGDKLYVPVSSVEEAYATSPGYACCNFRGSVVALDARSGAEKWRTWLVDPATAQGTSKGGLDKLGPSGVAVWNSPSIDAARGQLYVATGDNYSLPATGLSDAVVALDLKTGQIRWHYQALAEDTWNVACVTKTSDSCPDENDPDADFGAGTVLAKGKDGKELVLAGQKSGWVYGLDPANGHLAWKTRVGRGSPGGGVHFGMASEDGILFVPVTDNYFYGPKDFPPAPGLHAVDIATGRLLWNYASTIKCATMQCAPGMGGSITATAGMVIAGDDDGILRIFEGSTGKILWSTDTKPAVATVNGVAAHGGAISGGVGPIAYKGTVIVPSGYGFASKLPGNVLLVYGVAK